MNREEVKITQTAEGQVEVQHIQFNGIKRTVLRHQILTASESRLFMGALDAAYYNVDASRATLSREEKDALPKPAKKEKEAEK